MPAYAAIGGQWGDEGKGKIVDYMAEKASCVVRYAGGNNAGHTVINEQGHFSLHLVPSGIFWPHTSCVIGNGVVVDPDVLISETKALQERGIDTSRLYVDERAHLIMPYHILLDRLEEESRGSGALGTTGRGVGPAYMDKTARSGIRAVELLDLESLKTRLKGILDWKNSLITKVYEAEPVSFDDVYGKCVEWKETLTPYLTPAEHVVHESLARGEKVLLEGAQGTLLDLDHGTYPYVTSSSPSIGGACTGLGLSPKEIEGIFGVFKAYSTRVGSGPLVAEMDEDTASVLREKAWEYGTTTGRARRIGWFDAVAARYSARVNGFTSLVLTRLDVLDGYESLKICVGYELDGKIIDHFPSSAHMLDRCTPVYEELPGWDDPTASVTELDGLPPEALAYIKRLEELVGCEVDLISTGPERSETILIKPVL